MWTLLRLTLDLSVDTAKNAQVPLRKSCRPPQKCHKKSSAQQPSTVFAFRWWFACLDADGHQQAMVIHFDCGGLGHDLLCTIPKSNCDLNEFNFSNLFCITHLPNLKGFLSESKMVTYFCAWSIMQSCFSLKTTCCFKLLHFSEHVINTMPPTNRQDFHGRNLVCSKWLVVGFTLREKNMALL